MNSISARDLFPEDSITEEEKIVNKNRLHLVIGLILASAAVITIVVIYSVKLCQIFRKRLEMDEEIN